MEQDYITRGVGSCQTAVSLIIHTCGQDDLTTAAGLKELTAGQMLRALGTQYRYL
ncbi:MAG: hypothetical protein GY796_32270 [Chloroflexi bacterium]|nr:hypothetical protein [Chloroflexota bacterium]